MTSSLTADLDLLLSDLEGSGSTPGVKTGKCHVTPPEGGGHKDEDLDSMLRDLSKTSIASLRRPEIDAMVTEMKVKKSGAGFDLDQTDRWEYQGYGIWHQDGVERNSHTYNRQASTATKELDQLIMKLTHFKQQNHTMDQNITNAKSLPDSDKKSENAENESSNHLFISEEESDKSNNANDLKSNKTNGTTTPTINAKSEKTKEKAAYYKSEISMTITDSAPNTNRTAPALDAMLSDLSADLAQFGVRTTPTCLCAQCGKSIGGQVVTALGKTWHVEHFVCTHCQQPLGTGPFFERHSSPYCEPDYHALFSPRCAKCSQPVLDKCVYAIEKPWHNGCFACDGCERPFEQEEGYHEKGDKAFCRKCFLDNFAPRCGGCGDAIDSDSYVSALDRQWHADCFVCSECKIPFLEGNYFENEGKPVCEIHFHASRGTICAGCRKPITGGRCITAMFRKFHPEHFQCSFCLKQLNKGTFKEKNEKPFCHECHDRLFA